ncbi:response regulator [Hyalangium rubrum]|uniref:histidine kinase n=1 Tax=Hyalangium rubrum TaxID=3103134 RepID=A0ABU5HD39_9BACT|nr:response regulator [Hyalangium sp. s54d21]MDY7231378.1 response regulator [Hyalangium sp. s54d21]
MANPTQMTPPGGGTWLSKPAVGLAAVALVLLCALFALDRQGRLSTHDAYRVQLTQLQVRSLELEKDLLRARLELPGHEGTPEDEFAALRSRADGLHAFPTFLDEAGRRRLSGLLDEYTRSLAEAEALLGQARARELKEGVSQLLDSSLSLSAEHVLSTYLELYAASLAEAERMRIVFFVVALLLGAYLVVMLVRLERAGAALNTLNAELELRVGERTEALSSANAELRDSEARKAAILEGSLDGIIALDEASRILEFNPAAERIFRLPRAQALGRDFLSLGLAASVTPEQQQRVRRALRADAEPGLATRLELSGVRADGDVFPSEFTLIRVAAEGPPRFTAYVRDITERKVVERMKSEFVSTVSHELRTPLTSIRGSLGLLEGGIMGVLPAPVLDMVRIARTNTERLIRLINDILDLEKMEAGKLELRLQPVEVAEVVESTFGGVRAMADAAKVALRSEAVGAGLVRADRDRLIQVLTNLVSNAIKFSPAQGVVTVRASREAGGLTRFDVVDQGPGVPPEKRGRLFGKFQQLDSSDTRSKGGTGLGLAISQAILEQHGGRIEVHGEQGAGATFSFSLPVMKGDSGSLSMARDESRYNVLVVTADAEVSSLLRGLLTSEGYRKLSASSLSEAEKLIEAGAPDALVLEPRLPDGEGLELVRRLRQEPRTRELPVVMMAERTSASDGGDTTRVEWVGRPFDETHFLRALRYAVRVPGPARVLVVDDDADLRRLLRMRLERLGMACIEAENGERAVELAREVPPDLIVLDVMLPRLDGFEVVDMLRQSKFRGTPLIVFTVRELSSTELRQLTLGITRYFPKKAGAEVELVDAAAELLTGLLEANAPRKVAS